MTTTANIQPSIGAEIRLSEIQASTISLTHIPTTPTPALKCWTDWFNIDNPGWTGDYEKLDTLRRSGYKVCKQPDAVRCRTVQTHIDAKLTGRKLTCSPSVGFFCVNSEQDWGKTCLDYEVKFLCPCDYVEAPTKPPFDLRLGCWTEWLDRDGPGGTGDYEQRNLFSRPICDRPGAVQCRRTSNHQEALKTGQNLFCTSAMGLVCINKNQPNGGMCYNYEVRFLCLCPNHKDLFQNLTDSISTESSPLTVISGVARIKWR
ncbi:mucin-5AC-like isoform X2 [Oscarella lobularis]|uniref:mucin-5AC-like isoform X2 n=1 Tax=Oscarella lobularis TaxID=121494 RepID=UPI003313B180